MARRKRNYTVRTGDTAATIAKQLGVDPQTLMRANTGVSNLRPGMVLKQPPTPPKPGDAPGGGGLYWGTNIYNLIKGVLPPDQPQNILGGNIPGSFNVPTIGELWQRGTDWWGQNTPFGRAPDQPIGQSLWPSLYNEQAPQAPWTPLSDTSYVNNRIFSPETVAQLAAYQRPAGTKPDPRELFSQYRNSTDLRQQYSRTTGVFADKGVKPGLLPATSTTPGGTGGMPVDESGREYIPHEVFQKHMRSSGAEGRAGLAELAEYAASNYGIARVEAEDGTIQNIRVRNFGGGDIRFAPVAKTQGTLGYLTRSRRGGSFARIGGGQQQGGGNWSPGDSNLPRSLDYEVGYSEWYSAGGGKEYGIKSGKGKKWSRSSMNTYNDWVKAQEDYVAPGEEQATATDADFEAWVNQVTGLYGEDIWSEAQATNVPTEPPIPPPTGEGDEEISGVGTPYDYTTWAKGAFDRFSQLEQSDTKLGFYDWFQESQHIFGSAAWDNAMDKTVGGDYRTDKAKAAYEAYLGYEPDWEVEEPEFGGSAMAPRYQAGEFFDFDTRGGAVPMTRRKARPNYLGLINWRI